MIAPCCKCGRELRPGQRHGIDVEMRNWCVACIAAHDPELLTMIEPEEEPNDRRHVPTD